jgi:MerR family transcriptional regulator, mercuric resistance operon regulatory protein
MRTITASRDETFSIGELARYSGASIETIRYYERIKLLTRPARTAGNHRVFDSTQLRILVFIRRSRELGFSLDEIRAMLRLGGPGKALCRDVQKVAANHLKHIRLKLHDLKKLERLMAMAVSRCSGEMVPICPIMDLLDIYRSK